MILLYAGMGNCDSFCIIYSRPLFFDRRWGIIKLLIQINTLQFIYYKANRRANTGGR